MEKLSAFLRQNLLACIIGAAVLGVFGFLTLRGRECFNCEQTEFYKSGQRQGAGLRFRHK